MKISVNENRNLLLEEVYSGVVLKTADGEEMAICMRDSGFEFQYQGKWYIAKEGELFALSNKKDDAINETYLSEGKNE